MPPLKFIKNIADKPVFAQTTDMRDVTTAETEAAHRFSDARHLHRRKQRLRPRRLQEAPAQSLRMPEIPRSFVIIAENPVFELATTAAPTEMRPAQQASPPEQRRGPGGPRGPICKRPSRQLQELRRNAE